MSPVFGRFTIFSEEISENLSPVEVFSNFPREGFKSKFFWLRGGGGTQVAFAPTDPVVQGSNLSYEFFSKTLPILTS